MKLLLTDGHVTAADVHAERRSKWKQEWFRTLSHATTHLAHRRNYGTRNGSWNGYGHSPRDFGRSGSKAIWQSSDYGTLKPLRNA